MLCETTTSSSMSGWDNKNCTTGRKRSIDGSTFCSSFQSLSMAACDGQLTTIGTRFTRTLNARRAAAFAASGYDTLKP